MDDSYSSNSKREGNNNILSGVGNTDDMSIS